jgi:hypothetical protein
VVDLESRELSQREALQHTPPGCIVSFLLCSYVLIAQIVSPMEVQSSTLHR